MLKLLDHVTITEGKAVMPLTELHSVHILSGNLSALHHVMQLITKLRIRVKSAMSSSQQLTKLASGVGKA